MNKFDIALKKYIDIFTSEEMYFVNDTRNIELFKKYPLNTNADDIRVKLSAINDLDISQNDLMEDAIKHILNLKFDARLKQGDLSVVEELARIPSNGKIFHLLHFASVFCNFHRPDTFPIYSEQHLAFYRKYIKEKNLPLDPEKINTYAVFSKALNDLVNRLGLSGKMDYLHIRKFGWLYAETVVKESAS